MIFNNYQSLLTCRQTSYECLICIDLGSVPAGYNQSYFYVAAKLCGNFDSLLEPPQHVKPKRLGKWKTEPRTLTFSETYPVIFENLT